MYEVSTNDLIRFYSNKDPKPHYTTEFIKEHQQPGGGYINFAKVFQTQGKFVGEPGQNDNYEKINELIKQGELNKVFAFEKLDTDFITNIKVDKTIGEPNQKWHLLVSYFGQTELEGGKAKADLFKKSITCPELWLWLIEVAKDDEILCEYDIEVVYNQGLNYRARKITRKDWSDFLDSYRDKVKEIIFKSLNL